VPEPGFFFVGDLTTDRGVLGRHGGRGAAEASFFFFLLKLWLGSSTTTSVSLQLRTLRYPADEAEEADEVVAVEMKELAAENEEKEELVDGVGAGELEASGSGCTATVLRLWLRVGEPPHKEMESSPLPARGVEGEDEEQGLHLLTQVPMVETNLSSLSNVHAIYICAAKHNVPAKTMCSTYNKQNGGTRQKKHWAG
jgi:hypothetical protein